MRSAGTVNSTTRAIEVAIRRLEGTAESGPPVRVRLIAAGWREF
jgi:hypothetical protein